MMASMCKTDHSTNVLSLWSLLLMTYRALSIGTLAKRLTTSKLMRVSTVWRFTDFNNCTKWPKFFTKIPTFQQDNSVSYVQTSQGIARESLELTVGLRGMSGLWILGRPQRCEVLLWYGSQLMFQISRKGSFVSRKEFLYFPHSLSCRIFGQG
jgi:hypothetical protein